MRALSVAPVALVLAHCTAGPSQNTFLDAGIRGRGAACSRDEQCKLPLRCVRYACDDAPDAAVIPDASALDGAGDAARPRDAGRPDATLPDAARPDAGPADGAAGADASTPDAGPPDAAVLLDGGASDVGVDAATADTGSADGAAGDAAAGG